MSNHFGSKAITTSTLKTRSNGSNMLVKHYPTLLRGIGLCFDHCWIVLTFGCWSVQTILTPSNNIGFQYQTRNWRIFDHANKRVGRCWMKSLNEVKLHPSSSNTIQHYPTCLIMLFKRVKHAVSNNVL